MIRKLLPLLLLIAIAGCSVPNKTVRIYFLDKENKLVGVEREFPTVADPVTVAIDQLLKGPNDQESISLIYSEIPQGVRARSVAIEGDNAIIDLNSALGEYKGSTDGAKRLISQFIYTATSIKGVKYVMFKLQGNDNFKLGGDEYILDHPLSRDDFKN